MLRARQNLGKYRIKRRIGRGGFADVFHAQDTIEGVQVALKVPHSPHVDPDLLEDFRREARLAARLDHPNILPIKNAAVIDDRFVIAYPLGQCSLGDRLKRRISGETALEFSRQLIDALRYAHEQRIVHCDVKPDNLILFEDGRLRLADFGIAKVALRTLRAFGTGSIGFVAPEQALGRPSFRSDVFSAGLVIYRMFAGVLPEWPFEWPMKGHERLRAKLHPDVIALLRRALDPDPRRRYRDGAHMLEAFDAVRPRALRATSRRASSAAPPRRSSESRSTSDWKTVRRRQFQRAFGRTLETRHACEECEGPVSERMSACPWCGKARAKHDGPVRMPQRCPRCRRGTKSDWRFCAHCYGAGVGPTSTREYPDRRYAGRCSGERCTRRSLLPFSHYCPWCRTKVKRAWKIQGSKSSCRHCGWGVLPDYWQHCPWCAKSLDGARR